MSMEEFIIKTPKGAISWKKTAENLLKRLEINNTPIETDMFCPYCESNGIENKIMELGSEFYCKNEKCSFDKVLEDYLEAFTDKYNIRIENDF